jgi:serine/threonine protein kinase
MVKYAYLSFSKLTLLPTGGVMPLEAGNVLNNRYRILKSLGKGGFGEVYQAWDQRLDGPCAVKRNLQPSTEVHRQFEKEARLLFKLQHIGLPMVYDYFEELGEQYLVMQFIEGEDLQSMLNRQALISLQQALAWIEQVCAALNYLHTRQPPVIHRDIKPANIIITPEGRAVLVDFGIAKAGDIQQMTSTGARGVTPGFSPPEQYGPSGTDAQSDVYALAATLYALLTGKPPDDALLITLKEKPPVQPAYIANPKIPRRISDAIQAAMVLTRTERTRSVSQFVAALREQIGEAGIPAQPPMIPTHVQPLPPAGTQSQPVEQSISGRRNYRWLIWSTIFALVIVVASFLAWWSNQGKKENDLQPTAATLEKQATQIALQQQTTVEAEAREKTRRAAATDTPAAPASQIIDGKGVPMVLVESGPFEMGMSADQAYEDCQKLYIDGTCERSWFTRMGPVHTVYLDAYYIDQFEVTNASYAQCVADGACTPPQDVSSYSGDPYYGEAQYNNYPVINVSWEQADTYCRWRDNGTRLPTEAEWEKAARGRMAGGIPGEAHLSGILPISATIIARSILRIPVSMMATPIPHRWMLTRRVSVLMARITWRVMSGNGWQIGIFRIIMTAKANGITRPDRLILASVCCEAVHGTLVEAVCCRLFASGAIHPIGTTATAFAVSALPDSVILAAGMEAVTYSPLK